MSESMSPSGLLEYESLRPRPEFGCILASICQVRNCVAASTKASCEQDAADAFHVLLDCSWESQGPEFIFFFFLSLNSCVSETRTRLFTHLLNEHLLCAKALCQRVGIWVGPLLCL